MPLDRSIPNRQARLARWLNSQQPLGGIFALSILNAPNITVIVSPCILLKGRPIYRAKVTRCHCNIHTYILYTSQQEELSYTTFNLYSLILTIRNEQRH